jgi:nitroreductase
MLSPFADDRSLFEIIRAAQRAPSVYNTQPWSFWVRADDRIELRANIAEADGRHAGRWLEVTDPDARELAISCGAALFNLRMAIRVTGHEVAAWLLPDPGADPTLLASVEVVTGRVRPPTAEEQELYDAIPRRHTYRWPFNGRRVPANVLTEMTLTAAKEKGWLRVLFPFQATRWLHVAGQAEREFTRDRRYVAELRRWTSGAERGLGVPKAAYGPQPPPLSANPPVRDFGFDWGDGRPIERFESHPQLLALATDDDRPLDWLRAGQALQRALLTATRYGVAASFLTQPLELADHKHEPRRWPSAWPFRETPQMLIRVGYPVRHVPITPREDLPDVVDLRSHPPRHVRPPALPGGGRELSSRWHLRGRLPG